MMALYHLDGGIDWQEFDWLEDEERNPVLFAEGVPGGC